MRDTRPVELVVNLPEGVAEEVEEVRRTDPEFLSEVIVYGLCRRTIFEELQRTRGDRSGFQSPV
jgi:hypothetical protein